MEKVIPKIKRNIKIITSDPVIKPENNIDPKR